MGGSERSSKNSRRDGGHSSKDKGKGKEVIGKGKGKASQTIPEEDLLPSSLPPSSSLAGVGSQYEEGLGMQAPRVNNGDFYPTPAISNYSYSQSAPAQIAYSSYSSVPLQQQSYGNSVQEQQPTEQQQYMRSSLSTASYVAEPADLAEQLGDIQLSGPSNQNIQYQGNAGLQSTNPNADLNYTVAGTGRVGPSAYAATFGGVGQSTRTRSHGSATNKFVQNQGLNDKRARQLLGKKDFSVHKSKEYTPGRVLKIFWFEPAGGNARQNGTVMSGDAEDLGRQIRNPGKIRRFVIIESRKGSSTCIPIHTYNYQGTLKPGCHPEDHAMIYTTHRPPNYLNGENGIDHPKIRMVPVHSETLAPTSRINFGKVYTIEHNFLIAFIGQIARESNNDFWQTLYAVRNNNALTLGPAAGPAYNFQPPAPVNNSLSSTNYGESTPRNAQLPAIQQGPQVLQSPEENENTEQPPADPRQDGDRTPTPTSLQRASSHRRSDRDNGRRRERRDSRY